MIYNIRNATLTDALSLNVLSKNEMGYDCSVEQTEENLKQTLSKDYECVFVAESEGKIVGYLHGCDYCLLFSKKMVNLLGLAVDSNYTRMGIGSELIKTFEEWAIKRNAKGIRLVSGEKRKEAHKFYEKCGFESTKNQKNFKKMF